MEEDYRLVEIWLRRDPVRWLCGLLAGIFAGFVSMLVAMLISSSSGLGSLYPIKLVGTVLLGAHATDIHSTSGLWAGLVIWELICGFWGFVFAHFTGTNAKIPLLALGAVWGIFSWIFTWNLFLPSFKTIYAAKAPSGPAFAVCLAYGLALVSVGFFDSMARHQKKS